MIFGDIQNFLCGCRCRFKVSNTGLEPLLAVFGFDYFLWFLFSQDILSNYREDDLYLWYHLLIHWFIYIMFMVMVSDKRCGGFSNIVFSYNLSSMVEEVSISLANEIGHLPCRFSFTVLFLLVVSLIPKILSLCRYIWLSTVDYSSNLWCGNVTWVFTIGLITILEGIKLS